ncbi:lysine N(6)-hydroxylase/L-ornithine N(5)-oxygenase family protein [Salinibacterium sp. SYSU T00001]|uniref:lysine N(6)-hydroxylase/L-ornithine N(5)-oxygenase family protein n=1 Tax=Homoserinimonas sedimenticola TaxID=2986805 RepID=UPI0022361E52|nr:lysine N(6)-hydroxylase/L-ornithine N(5)-oxygenase family protein [Salinibacterium sedimenticola]MCW4385655.1 lysine N(6)-hydroxylase/L-ornithine N(5)-oxygenase family protein [Salinibacterium sedimenticola]
MMSELPVVVVGAGPQGLAAAAHLRERGLDAIVLERGQGPAAAVAEWGHVRLFSAWPELTDAAARRLLEARGWAAPQSGYPTGADWVRDYLAPLAEALGDSIRYGTTVTGISRLGRDRVVDDGRDGQPFVLHALDGDGKELRMLARAVIDASGTWHQPNPAGADGYPALGERAASDLVSYRIPEDLSAFAGRHLAVVGAGHSASHTVLRLAELARRAPGTTVTWMLRRGTPANLFGGGDADGLPERAALGARAKKVVDEGLVTLQTGFRVSELRGAADALTVIAGDGRAVEGVAHLFALTGFRPDTGMLSGLRIQLDPALEAVAGIADEIDPNIHSCGTVAATGARQLRQPEEGFFIVGAKSYGRAPTFLALTGYEQVRSVVAELAGDREAAARNELVLPETGVCGGAGDFGGGSCCSPAPLQIGRRPLSVKPLTRASTSVNIDPCRSKGT